MNWQTIKSIWASRPLAIILPVAALAWFWYSHKRLPSADELVTLVVLWTAKFDRAAAVIPGIGAAKTDAPAPPAGGAP